ncbi:MAG TPA: cation diffusion facilitator family transporter [Tepidisphaeraceae bacterium]|nr:cation diffusion facilitator family transporter [Tepidisphaeraceae bacterium]
MTLDAAENPPPKSDRGAVASETRAIQLSLAAGIILLGIKSWAYFITRSQAIFSDALENVVNVLASAFALYAITLSHRPADKEHPYGHGKVEFLSAGFEGGMILLAALIIGAQAILAIAHHKTPTDLDFGLILVAIAMVANGAVGGYLWLHGLRSGAIVLEAEGMHLASDAITSAAVLIALGLVRLTGQEWIDPAAAIGVAIYIIWLGWGLVRRSSEGLMDKQDAADTVLLRTILESHMGPSGREPHICSFHKLRHRHSGRYHWVDFHMRVPRTWDIEKAHAAASAIEYEIEQALGDGDATAHIEPCEQADCPRCKGNCQRPD